jgi:hypothetical protein
MLCEALERRIQLSSITVNSALDPSDPGHITLRDAILAANDSATPTSIGFDPTVFSSPTTITLSAGPLEVSVTNSVTITGPSAGLIVAANNTYRVLTIDTNATVALSDLTLTGATLSAMLRIWVCAGRLHAGGRSRLRGHNLVGIVDSYTSGWTTSDLTGSSTVPWNARLAALGFYGGDTQTMPPLPGRPALAGGSILLVPSTATTDQRGEPRVVSGTMDIGAVETGLLTSVPNLTGRWDGQDNTVISIDDLNGPMWTGYTSTEAAVRLK